MAPRKEVKNSNGGKVVGDVHFMISSEITVEPA